MFEMQAEGLEESLGINVQLKELYDSIEKEDRQKSEEYKLLQNESRNISKLLDSYCVPKNLSGRLLTLTERVDLALKERMYAKAGAYD